MEDWKKNGTKHYKIPEENILIPLPDASFQC
jgi:hypothetical protein